VAVEGGVVEALGWNQYGGWRIGIRSLDSKRYYYYAPPPEDFPYRKDLKVGGGAGGDVIGYLGRTGYSVKENVNNIQRAHLISACSSSSTSRRRQPKRNLDRCV
jgi:hypothetical protein